MRVKNILTPLDQTGDGLEPLNESGRWVARSTYDDLSEIASRLRMGELDRRNEDIVSIPDVWAQVEVFRNSLEDDSHPLHLRSVREWRGLLALFALSGLRQYSLETELHDLKFESGLTNPQDRVKEILKRSVPKAVAAEELTWDAVATIRLRTNLVGLVVPSTIVCPARGYAANVEDVVPWVGEDGLLLDPCESLNVGFEQLSVLWHFLDDLQTSLLEAKGGGSEFPLTPMLVGQVQAFQESVDYRLNGKAPAPTKRGLAGRSLPNHSIYRVLNQSLVPDVLQAFDTLLRPRVDVDNSLTQGAILYDQDIANSWAPGRPETIRIWGLSDLHWLNADPLRRWPKVAEQIEREGYTPLTPDEIFTPTLTELADAQAPGNADSDSHFTRYVLPLNPAILLFLKPDELRRRLSITTAESPESGNAGPSGPVVVTLALDLESREGGGTRPYSITKVYHASAIHSAAPPSALATWPNFVSSKWQHYFIYCSREQSDLRTSMPFTPGFAKEILSTPSAESRQRDLRAMHTLPGIANRRLETASDEASSLFRLKEAPEAIVLRLPGSSGEGDQGLAGFVLMPEFESTPAVSTGWEIGVDFGTTNTSAAIKHPTHGIQPVSFDEKRVLLPITRRDDGAMSEITKAYLAIDFIPKQDVKVPFLGVLHDRRVPLRGRPSPIWDAHISLAHEVTRTLDRLEDADCSLRFNLKWSNEFQRQDDIEVYITQVLLHSLAEAVAQGADPIQVKWKFGYPEAFTASRFNVFRQVYRNAIWRTLDSEMLESESQPEMPPMISESYATALYFQSKQTAQFTQSAITVDIGGHTSDVTIWQNQELVWRSSLELGGQHIYLGYLAKNLDFFRDIAEIDRSFAEVYESLMRVSDMRIQDGLEVVVNSREYQDLFRKDSHRLLETPAGLGFKHVSEIALSGLVFYLAAMVRHLIQEGRFENARPPLYFCLGGRSSEMLQRVVDENERKRLADLFREVSGYDHGVEMFTFSQDPKLEVAFGLLAAGGGGSLALQGDQKHKDSILGESLKVNGVTLGAESRLSELPASDDWEISDLSNLQNFVDSYQRHMSRRLPISSELKNNLIGRINGALADARQEASNRLPAAGDDSLELEQLVALEPPFIVALRSLVGMINAGDLEIKSRAE